MLNMLKPFGDDGEKVLVGDLVNYMTLTETEGPAREKELEEKLRICDILVADVDIKVNESLMEKAPKLKYVLCTSAGVDYVDLEAATRRNIIVANNPDFCVVAVAEYAVGLMYAIMRRIPEGAAAVAANNWQKRELLEQKELFGKTLGIIGFGKTGKDVVRQALGIGMKVHVRVHEPDLGNKADEIRAMGAIPMNFDQVISSSDVLSLHVPMTDDTRNLIGEREFERMRDGAYLINVARGGVVNEEALLKNLNNGKLAGAALDVLIEEPPTSRHPLLNYQGDNLIITPHAAWFTSEADQKNNAYMIKQVTDIVQGNTPQGIVNTQVQARLFVITNSRQERRR